VQELWAPWRMEYILNADKPVETGCIFCNRFNRSQDEEDLILFRGAKSFVIMNRFPYNNGHLMVTPCRHIGSFQGLTPDEALEVHKLVSASLDALKKVMKPDGFNVGLNLGRVAGAGVEDHVHWHIVPRWNGDTNFMPVIGETKVMPEHLASTWRRLREAFREVTI
jgi:ATP adenylyltransferase